ncbi:hypothetical protein ASD21_15845 [Caulobacter sp. Root1455]|uniref:hypothetical protein n=1 Tax=Caulobacter sp. Root1455 TaxID=1736465 RepID=UPI0006FDB26E|nr:hypothetical protein [Caulobacter sp. Root1455]KQY91782.1 hypothetical protein ASD21_15845 [Caulobacter sp. Root1455]
MCGSGPYGGALSLDYNAAGQIKTRSSSNPLYEWTAAATPRGYTINGRKQTAEAGSSVLAYDGRGNLTNDGATAFGYDLDSPLTSATSGSGVATLSYDPLGRLDQTAKDVTARRCRPFRPDASAATARVGGA